LLIFTDLDGTLLDHSSYSFQSALPALKTLRARNIPLIFCTSKTRTETEKIRKLTENTHPFIVENGGAVYIPNDYFTFDSQGTEEFPLKHTENAEYRIIEQGTPYARLREVLSKIQAQYPKKLKGFGDLSIEAIAKLCEFSLEDAHLAKQREYDEPFLLEDESLTDKIQEIARQSGLQITQGGRFHHLMGANDKGQAVLRLIAIYRQKFAPIQSVALGDSLNDLSMLTAVDIPILLPKPDGRHDPTVIFDGLFFAKDPGPSGWSDAVFTLLRNSL
jgi:mannosyl-3-phosphoglycerate phosphatase